MKKLIFFKSQLIFLLLFSLFGSTCFASFNKELWPKWQANNPLSTKTISHHEWQEFLHHHVKTSREGINLIDYSHINEVDRNRLNQYINRMSQVDINNYNRNEQLAFWINVYNAITVQLVCTYYPVDSIQEINISPGLFSIGPWGANLFAINNSSLSLEDIHNKIIRPIWNDPRTHYVINNASLGAPNIGKFVYQGKTIEKQLNLAAKQYINSLRGVQVLEGKLILSQLYNWFFDDFGGAQNDLIEHLKIYSNKPLRKVLEHISEVSTYNYNWHLNTVIDNS